MDFIELGDMGSGCDDESCGLASSFQDDCPNQDCHLEEPGYGFVELVCVTVIYIPLLLLGLLGNILTILVVWLRPHMRSSTYLYLSSMAVSDLMILLLLPLDLYKLWRPRPWPFGDLACKLTMFMSECCTFCTILHITFLSLERYLAVCWPITTKTLVTRRRTKALISFLWIGAVFSAAPVLVMVGVEEIGAEESGLVGWREDKGWTHREGKQGGFVIGGWDRESEEAVSIAGGLEGLNWGDSNSELKWFEEKGGRELKTGENERKQGQEGGGEEEIEGEHHNNEKKDDRGKTVRRVNRGRGQPDIRECRCTHYALSSGLLSAMAVLYNLYFLVPFCILGLVYSLIGRTLWLRPQSSRRDQSDRHTVKMLGVIVLAFVLCWLPFHVGRTIFYLPQDSSTDGQEAYNNTKADLQISTAIEDVSVGLQLSSHLTSRTTQKLINSGMQVYDLDPGTKMHAHNLTDNITHITDISNTHSSFLTVRSSTTHLYKQKRTKTHLTKPTDPYADTRVNNTHTHSDSHYSYYLFQYFNLVSSVLFYLSAAINPLLYNLMSARYRHAVHSLIHKHAHTQTHRRRTLTGQHSMTTL